MHKIDLQKPNGYISLLYAVTLFILAMDTTDFFPFGSVLRKIKYFYIAVVAIYYLRRIWGRTSKKVLLLTVILLIHTVIFGLIATNPDVADLTRYHFREMMTYIAIIFFTAYFVWNEHLFKRFVSLSYVVFASVMVLAGIVHSAEFCNPIYFIYVFSSSHGYRSEFGFGHANMAGNMLIFILIYSMYLLNDIHGRPRSKENRMKFWCIIVVDIFLGEMLFSTESRTSILAGVVFIGLFFGIKVCRRLDRRVLLVAVVICICAAGFLLASGAVSTVWANSNRDANYTVNIEYFKLFSPWTGMGYLPPYCFLTKSYGYATFACDVYYLYIFFTTGYIGTALISLFLLLEVSFVLRTRRNSMKDFMIALMGAWLFTGLGTTCMLCYTLIPSMITQMIIMYYITSAPVKK